jgi:hypothetical protein
LVFDYRLIIAYPIFSGSGMLLFYVTNPIFMQNERKSVWDADISCAELRHLIHAMKLLQILLNQEYELIVPKKPKIYYGFGQYGFAVRSN